MLLPRACPMCGRHGPAPCHECAASLRPPPALPNPPGTDACRALLAYDGEGRELVARLKYRNARASVGWLAGGMAALVDATDIDVVTWLPTSSTRRRGRGFDQSALLARAVARRLRRPCRPLLRRRPGPPQTGRDRGARLNGPQLTARAAITGTVLVVDDVVTTGASATAAAAALREAGASRVLVVVAARTPLKALRTASETRK